LDVEIRLAISFSAFCYEPVLSVIAMSTTRPDQSRERREHQACQASKPGVNCSSKVPEVTLAFWIIKVAATTLGETGGDALSMKMHLGYALSTAVFRTLLFWLAFILTRPLGATVGDLLTKPFARGGLNLDRISSSLVIAIFMAAASYSRPGKRAAIPAAIGNLIHSEISI
jgi:uncharacterized membrane-anchored protein